MSDVEVNSRRRIPVTESAMVSAEPWDLPEAVAHHVQLMLESGARHDELVPAAVQLHAIDRYRGEVSNGGHDQYFGNACPGPEEFDRIETGLLAAGAHTFLPVVRDVRAWLEANPDERHMEHAVRAKALDPLDARFYVLDQDHALRRLLGNWIRRQPELLVLPSEDYVRWMTTLPRPSSRTATL